MPLVSNEVLPYSKRLGCVLASVLCVVVGSLFIGASVTLKGGKFLQDDWLRRVRKGQFDAVVRLAPDEDAQRQMTPSHKRASLCLFTEGQALVMPIKEETSDSYTPAHFLALDGSSDQYKTTFKELTLQAGCLDIAPGKAVLGLELARRFYPPIEVGQTVKVVGPSGACVCKVAGLSSVGQYDIDTRLLLSINDAQGIMPAPRMFLGLRLPEPPEAGSLVAATLKVLPTVSPAAIDDPMRPLKMGLQSEQWFLRQRTIALSAAYLLVLLTTCVCVVTGLGEGVAHKATFAAILLFAFVQLVLCTIGSALLLRWFWASTGDALPSLTRSSVAVFSGYLSTLSWGAVASVFAALIASVMYNPRLSVDAPLAEGLRLAPARKRLCNWLVDSLAIQVLVFLTWFALREHISFALLVVIAYVEGSAYYVLYEGLLQQTLGKRLTGTRVVSLDSCKPGIHAAARRTVARMIPFHVLSYWKGTWWHDRWTDTRVVLDPQVQRRSPQLQTEDV